MTLRLPFKRGATFELDCVVTDDAGSPEDVTSWTIASQVRDKAGVLVDDLEVVNVNRSVGQYKLHLADTTAWPINQILYCDIKYTTDTGQIVPTETFEIQSLVSITE